MIKYEADFWDERYGRAEFGYGTEPDSFVREKASLFTSGDTVLVPGDGEGRNGVYLATAGLNVTTVDLSPNGVKKALSLAAQHGVQIEAFAADLTEWEWPVATCQGVVSIFLHLPPDVRVQLHKAMADALAPGGYIVLQGYTPDQIERRKEGAVGGPGRDDMLFTRQMIESDFAGLTPISIEEKLVDFGEGGYHSGKGSVIQAIFQK